MSEYEITQISIESWDWEEIDRAFYTLPGGPSATNPKPEGESWQYMETKRVYGPEGQAFYSHLFKHRNHPTVEPNCGHYLYLRVDASKGWEPVSNDLHWFSAGFKH